MNSTEDQTKGTGRGLSKFELSAISILVAGMTVFLNHSIIAGGFNTSLADVFLLGMLVLLLITSRLYLMRYALIFFAVLVAITASATIWLTPALFGVSPEPRAVFGDIAKLVISFLYFTVGVSVARLQLQGLALKWFAVGAAVIAAAGIVMEISGVRFMEETLYYHSLRYRGFMSDPNFYALLACSGFAYFAYTSRFSPIIRIASLTVLAVSVIFSGSKTGLVTLLVLIVIILVTRAARSKTVGVPALLAALATGGVVLVIASWNSLVAAIHRLSEDVPQLERVSTLLSGDLSAVLSGSGSGRETVWSTGLQIIDSSPVFGVGFGAYSEVGDALFGKPDVAHNTYIQLAAEWGLVLALCLFTWIATLLVRASFSGNNGRHPEEFFIFREIIIVFMIGSLSLSLNNARMLWFFLGILAFMCHYRAKIHFQERKKETDSTTPIGRVGAVDPSAPKYT